LTMVDETRQVACFAISDPDFDKRDAR